MNNCSRCFAAPISHLYSAVRYRKIGVHELGPIHDQPITVVLSIVLRK